MADLNWDDDVDPDETDVISLPKYYVNDSGGDGVGIGSDRSVIMYHNHNSVNPLPLPVSTFPPFFKAVLDYTRSSVEEGILPANEISDNESISNSTGTMLDVMNGTSNVTRSGARDELYDVPLSIIILLSLLYGGISVAALIGNLLVLWVVTVSRRMRTVTNMFIANLALADIIIGLFTIPFQFQAALLQRWNLPDFMCAFCPFVQILSVNVSVFTLSAIAVDRYRAVLFPLSARASKRKATWAILSIWSLSLVIALPTEVDYKVIEIMDKGKPKPFCTNLGLSQTFRTYYTLSLVVIQYFFPLIIITGAYAHMATKLWGTTAPGNKEESRDAVVLRNKKKVIKMLALVVLLFALCWMPLQMYYFLQTLIPSINQYQYINIIWFCFHWLAMGNSCCNPFIYAIYNDKFQREFRARLWCHRICLSRHRNGDDNGYSEASDFDRTKIRASYRFTNSRSVRYNQHGVCGGGGGGRSSNRSGGNPGSGVDRRNSSYHSRRSMHHRPCDRTESGGSGRHQNNPNHYLNPHDSHHHPSEYGSNRYLGPGPNYGTGSSQSNLSINNSPPPSPSPLTINATTAEISEFEVEAALRNGGGEDTPYLNGGSAISRLAEQEPSKSQTAVVASNYCRPLVSLANNNVKTVTVVATETTCKL